MNISTQSWIAAIYLIASLVNPTCCDGQVRNDLQPPPSAADDADRKRVGESLMLVKNHKPQIAIDELNPVIANYQERNKNTRPYCSRSLQESVLYMAHAAEDKTSATIVNHVWCDALYVKAYASVDLGQLENAETSLKEVIAMAPSNAPYLSELGEVFSKKKDWDNAYLYYQRAEKAAEEFSPATVKNDELARALRGEAFVDVERKQFDHAEVLYERCLSLNANDAIATRELDYVRGLKGR